MECLWNFQGNSMEYLWTVQGIVRYFCGFEIFSKILLKLNKLYLKIAYRIFHGMCNEFSCNINQIFIEIPRNTCRISIQ